MPVQCDEESNEAEIRQLNSELAQRAALLEQTNHELQVEIASRKRTEKALQESNSALEAFSYSVSHDLRAPLRAMQGFGRVLIEDYSSVLDPMGIECANRIVSAAERMDGLINEILFYSRLGHAELDLSPIKLDAIVEATLSSLAPEILLTEADLEVEKPLPEVLAHEVTLRQVLINLISNSLKFMAPGVRPSIQIRASVSRLFARLEIADNGIGIHDQDKERVFQVFERLGGSANFPGTGLGLAIVKKGIDRMGGRVGVESAAGEGSRFWIELKIP